jgi:transcriptional/translational regulatory protein YebC/TACO1
VKAADGEPRGFRADIAEITLRADNDIDVSGDTRAAGRQAAALVEDLDDVQNVYSNADLGEDAYA